MYFGIPFFWGSLNPLHIYLLLWVVGLGSRNTGVVEGQLLTSSKITERLLCHLQDVGQSCRGFPCIFLLLKGTSPISGFCRLVSKFSPDAMVSFTHRPVRIGSYEPSCHQVFYS